MHQLKALPNDVLPYAARDIEGSCADLLAAIQRADTFDRAMAIWKVARMLETEIAKVASVASDRAETLIGK